MHSLKIKRLFSKKMIFSFLLAALIFYFLLSKIDFFKSLEIVLNSNVFYIVLALLAYYLSYVIKGYRWRLLLLNNGINAGLWDIIEINYLGQFVNCLLPARIGEIYKAHLVKRNFNVSRSQVIGTIFFEKLLDIFFLVFFLLIIFFFIFKEIFPSLTNIPLISFSVLAVLIIATLCIIFMRNFLIKLLPERFKEYYENFRLGIINSLKYHNFYKIFFFSIAVWIIDFTILFIITRAVNITLPFFYVAFASLLLNIIWSIPLTPSGLGFVELTISGIFIFFGIPKEIALGIAIIERIIAYINPLITGYILYLLTKK